MKGMVSVEYAFLKKTHLDINGFIATRIRTEAILTETDTSAGLAL
jgi:hypothetical protein